MTDPVVVPCERILIVKGTTAVEKLAGAIAWGIRGRDNVTVEAMGLEAILRAAAAIKLAQAYLFATFHEPPAGMVDELLAKPEMAMRDIPDVGPRPVLVLKLRYIRQESPF